MQIQKFERAISLSKTGPFFSSPVPRRRLEPGAGRSRDEYPTSEPRTTVPNSTNTPSGPADVLVSALKYNIACQTRTIWGRFRCDCINHKHFAEKFDIVSLWNVVSQSWVDGSSFLCDIDSYSRGRDCRGEQDHGLCILTDLRFCHMLQDGWGFGKWECFKFDKNDLWSEKLSFGIFLWMYE